MITGMIIILVYGGIALTKSEARAMTVVLALFSIVALDIWVDIGLVNFVHNLSHPAVIIEGFPFGP
jgi:hypothetical protein